LRDSRKRIVEAGYDVIAERYLTWAQAVEGDPRDRFLDELIARLPGQARVLDLGCGGGIPSTRRLAERFDVVGVDISEAQLRVARANVPGAMFIRGDMSELDLPDASFDGITAFYSISHLPRDEHGLVFQRVGRWLKPGGLFLATLGADDLPDRTGDWLGAPMFFSSFDAATNRTLVRTAGFDLALDEMVAIMEPEQEVTFLWILARKSQRSPSAV
jgi:ubiquinone/menaquinone biosynthesis C-methylase UbiE